MSIKNSKISTIFILILLFLLVIFLIYPIIEILLCSISDNKGEFVGLYNFYIYFNSSGLLLSLQHSIIVSSVVTIITIPISFILAYSLVNFNIYGQKICRQITLLPIFVPSLLPAIGLIYLFGPQGILKGILFGHDIYGVLGIVIAESIFALPHATLLLVNTFRNIDNDIYYAASVLGAGYLRRFLTVTISNSRYGIISACLVVFTLTITDFGVPKVIGGNYSVLATEIFSQVIGQQNLNMGSVIGIILLIPTLVTLLLDYFARHNTGDIKSNFFQCKCKKHYLFLDIFCWLLLILPFLSIFIVVFASFISFWPYDMSFSLGNYDFESLGYDIKPLVISIYMAIFSALLGTIFIFTGSYLIERCRIYFLLKSIYRFFILLPMSIPGLVLGLAYLFAFNSGVFSFISETIFILIANTIIHFSTTSHLTCTIALQKLNRHYENVGRSAGVSVFKTIYRIIIPLSWKMLIDIFFYIFTNAMTTVSAMAFICSGSYIVASMSVVSMHDSGHIGAAAAMGSLILLITSSGYILQNILKKY